MKNFQIIIITILCFTFLNANAQNINRPKPNSTSGKTVVNTKNDPKAIALLEKASAAFNNAGGVKAGFTLKTLGMGGKTDNVINGTIKLKGSRFRLDVKEMITWFDGKNQWVYLTDTKEVNLSNPTEDELLMINPVNVFQLYKHGYNSKYAGEKNEGGKIVIKIQLVPSQKYSTLQNIDASFDKVSLRPVKIIITNKDKSGSTIDINTYVTGQSYPDKFFSFPQNEYPNLDVIDLR
jgi:outer membrane lipoprotein-sorting protein